MSYQQLKEMPHIIKPAILLLALLQIIFMAIPGVHAWGWFVILTAILELLVAIAVVAAFFFDIGFIEAPQYNIIELLYSAVFAVCSALNTIYFFVNIFTHFNFFFLLDTVLSVLLALGYGLQALVCFNQRNAAHGGGGGGRNQATATPAPATYPAGVNPA